VQELKINPAFRDLIPPLADHEREGLEEDIKHFGCQCPITTWNGFIVDGHHRYEICNRHKLSFKTEEREFEDEKAVMIWMIDNQMGRRNITIAAKIQLAMKKYGFLSDRAREKSLSNLKQFQHTEEILSNVVSERLSIPSVFFIFKPLSLVLLRP